MITSVRVEAAVPGRRAASTAEHPVDIELPSGPVELRQLISAIVRAEIVAFLERSEHNAFVRVLTEESLAQGLQGGAVRTGGRDGDPPAPDVDECVSAALLAFEDGLYHVYVDDEPAEQLDGVVDLRQDSRLLFVRLVALSGG